MSASDPSIVVFTTLFPSPAQPQAGVFIRERMFRIAATLPLTVVAPRPWFPFQSVLRKWRPHFRPESPAEEVQEGIRVLRPRFMSFPGMLKRLDGLFLAWGSFATMRRLKRSGRLDILDAHFAYPDGYAAGLLGAWLRVPVTVTLRGTEIRHALDPVLMPRVRRALQSACRIFAVAESLKRVACALGVPDDKVRVVGNGVDTDKFHETDKRDARRRFGLPDDAPVMISVGGLVERKGFHRVIECMPALLQRYPNLQYVIVGAAGPEGDYSEILRAQVRELGLVDRVHFVGSVAPQALKVPLSAADIFVLATRNEGWANVFLEAMACGLPVVTTDVGGNREVVCDERLGIVVPFGERTALQNALFRALEGGWDRDHIVAYARRNSWDSRVRVLLAEFRAIAGATPWTALPDRREQS
jgi:teichuronic acid biosynthesis glycosyltransferase TuaC